MFFLIGVQNVKAQSIDDTLMYIQGLEERNIQLENEAEILKTENSALKNKSEGYVEQISTLQYSITDLETELNTLKEQKDQQKTNMILLQDQMEEQQEEQNRLVKELEYCTVQVEEQSVKIFNFETDAAGYKKNISYLSDDITRLTRELEAREEHISTLKDEINDLKMKLRESNK